MPVLAAFVLEIMDKEWPLWFVLVGFLGFGFVRMLWCRKWPMAALVMLPLLVFSGIAQVMELNDPFVGEAIRREAGTQYFILSYLAMGGSLVFLVVGVLWGLARRRRLV